jgi:hypothetical protein
MKKALSIIIILLITFTAFAQKRTVFINEFFNDIDIPEGWKVTGGGKNNWSISESNLAGGNANELKFSWTPQHYGISRMVTNAVDLTNVNSVYLSFKHFLNNHDGENTIGVATSSDNGNTWNIAWSQSYSSTGGFVINENISTSDMGKSNVLFCIFFDGVSNTITSWHFDDFMILTQDDYNINLLSIDVNNNLNAGETDITFTIQNEGISTVESFEARYDIKGLCSVTQTFNTNMGTLDSKQFTFDTPAVIPPGTYNLSVEITSINNNEDNYPNNNIIEEEYCIVDPNVNIYKLNLAKDFITVCDRLYEERKVEEYKMISQHLKDFIRNRTLELEENWQEHSKLRLTKKDLEILKIKLKELRETI